MRVVAASPYGVRVSKPSNNGNREPTLGAGGRRFKSCLPDHYKSSWMLILGLTVAEDWLGVPARLTSFPVFLGSHFADGGSDGEPKDGRGDTTPRCP